MNKQSAPAPRRAAPPPPPSAAKAAPQSDREFAVISGRITRPQRVVLYGPGGIGKSTLAALAPNPVVLDIEDGTSELDVPRIDGIGCLADLRACLQSSALDAFGTIVIDSATRCEEWSVAETLETVPHEKGNRVTSIEGYGFGKGYQHVYDTFLRVLSDIDSQVRRGRNVVLIAHDCVVDKPNPAGDDFIRWEPHLQSPKSGKASIRNRVVQWADHVLFLGYDVNVQDGKGHGSGTRTIYPTELPHCVAKSRLSMQPMPFTSADDGAVWDMIFGGNR